MTKAGKAEKILLLDANALIHRSFHALPPLTTPKGEQVNAVYGFASALLKAIKDERPDYVVACFDAGRVTFRHAIFKDYKAHRKETDEALSLQIPRVKQIVEVLNIPLFAQKGIEADDLIGCLARRAAKDGLNSVIVTGDNDALQLVNQKTTVYSLRRGVTDTLTYDRETVKEKFGIYPEQMIDYKALAGDSSDNIPGAPGVGPKTAVDLLTKYHDLEGVYAHLDELKDRLREILQTNKEQVMMSREIATIKCDLPVDLSLEDAAVENFDFSRVVNLFAELDFRSLLAKLPQPNLTQAKLLQDEAPREVKPQLPFEAITTRERWEELQPQLLRQSELVLDTETVDFDGDLIGVAFAWGKNEAAYLPLAPADKNGLPIEEVRHSLGEVLESDAKKIGHNLKYDLHALVKTGFKVNNVWFDTMLASQLVNSQLYAHGLDALALTELGFKKIRTIELLGGKKSGKMTDAPLESLAAYACEDVIVTWRLWEKFFPMIEDLHTKRVFYEIEMPLLPVLVGMERAGIKVDLNYLEELGKELRSRLAKIETEAKKALGNSEVNIASPSQLQKVLFTDLNLPVIGVKKIKSGYSTDAETLLKLRDAHSAIPLILEYRELAKLLNTYIETLPESADNNGRIHTSFGQIGAATGRMSSNDPNLQNIPIRTELGNKVRRAFVADKDKVLLGADYSQAELRVLAHLSEDPGLIEAFRQEADFHAAVATQLGVDRRAAKAINFGIIYGLGPTALAADLGITTTEAKEFIDKYFATFPGVAKFIESKKRQAREVGYTETLFGRRRYLPEIHSPNMMLRSAAERIAVNMPCQGTVADLMKMSMVALDGELPKGATMLLQIHDELLFEVDKNALEKTGTVVRVAMSSVAQLKVPMVVGLKAGSNWADLREV